MKRTLTFLIFLIALQFSSEAQVQRFRFGLQASPVFSWLDTDDRWINSNGTNLGFRLGLKADYFFSEKYAISTGIGFAFNQGGELLHDFGGELLPNSELSFPNTYRNLPDDAMIGYNIRYIEVPLSMKMLTNEIFRDFRFFFEVPVITLGFESNVLGSIEAPGVASIDDEDLSGDVNFLNLSWGLGGGAEYNIRGSGRNDTNLVFGAFYNQGFTDVTRDKGATRIFKDENMVQTEQPEDSTAILRGVTIYLGIMF